MSEKLNVITFSYAKRALIPGSRENLRISAYAAVLSEFHVIVFTRAHEGYASYQQEGGTHFYATNSTSRLGMLIDAYKIAKRIISTQKQLPWVVSAQDPLASSLVPAVLSYFNRSAVLHIQIHGDVFNKHFFVKSKWGWGIRFYAHLVCRRAKKIRVVSERIKRSLVEKGVSAAKIVVLPIQADINSFLIIGKDRIYRAHDVTRFLYVGRFSSEKNIPALLSAFARIKREGANATLTLLGDGPQKTFLKQEARRLEVEECVQFLEWTDKVSSVMATADVLCVSSLHEGYAMVLLEAMAAGLPIITTDVGAADSFLIDGMSGRVLPVNDVVAYANAMQEFSVDASLRERFGKRGYLEAQKYTLSEESYLQAIAKSFMV